MHDPLNDGLRQCNCPGCGACLQDRARYFLYEASADWPHVITARCDACQRDHKFRLKPVDHYYECLPIPETAEQ